MKYSQDPVQNAIKVIEQFIANKFPYLPNSVKYNKIILTDVSTSTLAWVEDNVVFELYFMHPNTEIVLHSHPFKLSSIFMDGDVEATVLFADKYTHKVKVEKEQFGKIRPVLPEFTKHGFKVGPSGATFYTIQIWDQIVTEPKSATEEYIGKPLGPVHKQQLL